MLGGPVIGRRRLPRLGLLLPRLHRLPGLLGTGYRLLGAVRRLLEAVRRLRETGRRWRRAGRDAAGATVGRRRGSNRSPRRPVMRAFPDLHLGVVQVRSRFPDGGRVRIRWNTGRGHSLGIPVLPPGRPRISTTFRTRSLLIRLVAPGRSVPLARLAVRASLVAPARSMAPASLVTRLRLMTRVRLVTPRLALRGTPRCRIPGRFLMMTASRTPTRSPRPRTLVRRSTN